jgi:drug/metabolite transporter (DMT)-like permease
VDAVVLACLSGLWFGGVTILIRLAMSRVPDVVLGGFAATLVALAVTVAAAAAAGDGPASLDPVEAWPFFVVGLFVPGASQVLYVLAIREAGPSRAGIVIGTSPLLSALVALAALDEPFTPALVAGTVLIVGAAIALAYERERPAGFAAVGLVLALGVAVMLAARDNVVRGLVGETAVPPLGRAVTLVFGCVVFVLGYLVATRGRRALDGLWAATRAYAPAGTCMGLVYVCLLIALDRGRVTVVAPLNGTNALWTVVLAAVLLRRQERVGSRLVLAAVLTVAGGALIGVFR